MEKDREKPTPAAPEADATTCRTDVTEQPVDPDVLAVSVQYNQRTGQMDIQASTREQLGLLKMLAKAGAFIAHGGLSPKKAPAPGLVLPGGHKA
ncbi:MAG: hypothetical protein NTY77_05580 [Elusimicrobia bacterium]|nr:hypothetical protein [Elusimicrobiota bacterium]